MNNLIEIWAYKNVNKQGKRLQFEDFGGRTFWIDPAGIDYVDPYNQTIHFADNLVFKLHNDKAIDDLIAKVNE